MPSLDLDEAPAPEPEPVDNGNPTDEQIEAAADTLRAAIAVRRDAGILSAGKPERELGRLVERLLALTPDPES